MALDARRRSSIYRKLEPLLGGDDANALMSEFPSIEGDELATREFVRAETAEQTAWFERRINSVIRWNVSTMLTGMAMAFAAAKLIN